jgi:hypothetical protein
MSWAKIELDILLLHTAVRQFRRRPHGDDASRQADARPCRRPARPVAAGEVIVVTKP